MPSPPLPAPASTAGACPGTVSDWSTPHPILPPTARAGPIRNRRRCHDPPSRLPNREIPNRQSMKRRRPPGPGRTGRRHGRGVGAGQRPQRHRAGGDAPSQRELGAAVGLSAAGQSASPLHVAVDPGGDAVAVWERSKGSVQAATPPRHRPRSQPSPRVSATPQSRRRARFRNRLLAGPSRWRRDRRPRSAATTSSRRPRHHSLGQRHQGEYHDEQPRAKSRGTHARCVGELPDVRPSRRNHRPLHAGRRTRTSRPREAHLRSAALVHITRRHAPLNAPGPEQASDSGITRQR